MSRGAHPMIDLKAIRARCKAANKGLWEVVYAHGWALGVGVDMSKPGTILQAFEMIGNTLRKNTPDTRAAQDKLHHNAQFIAHARQDLPDCIKEIERLRDILRTITTKHSLLKNLSAYGPCKCKGSVLCMKHAAADIINMIDKALEEK